MAAENNLGRGDWSDEITVDLASGGPAGAPRELTGEFKDDPVAIIVKLSWKEPVIDNDDPPITGYLIWCKFPSEPWLNTDDDILSTPHSPEDLAVEGSSMEFEIEVPVGDYDQTYNCRVAALNLWGVDEENGWAYASVTVPPRPSSNQQEANSPAAGQVEITGRAQVGETLAANSVISDADGTSQASYAYQWLADGEEITGATGNTYELTAAQLGRRITVRVAFTDDRSANHHGTMQSRRR